MYGVALASLGMLSTLATCLTIDVYGPISDNAGGIAEMVELPSSVRDKTDALDAAGNTTAAIGKGFAIGSAALVSLALFGAFITRASADMPADKALAKVGVNLLTPVVFGSLVLGAMIPYWFSALTMKSVGQVTITKPLHPPLFPCFPTLSPLFLFFICPLFAHPIPDMYFLFHSLSLTLSLTLSLSLPPSLPPHLAVPLISPSFLHANDSSPSLRLFPPPFPLSLLKQAANAMVKEVARQWAEIPGETEPCQQTHKEMDIF